MLSGAIKTVATRYVVTIILLIQSILWTRLLGPEARGLYAKLQTGQSFLILFLGLGVTSGIVYFVSGKRIPRERVWGLSLALSWIGALVTGLLVLLDNEATGLDLLLAPGYRNLFFDSYFFLSFVFLQYQLSVNAFLAADQHFDAINRVELQSSLARLLLVIGATLMPRQYTTVAVLFGLDLLTVLIKALLLRRHFRRRPTKAERPLWHDVKQVLLYSLMLYALYVIQFFSQRLDVWIIERWHGLDQLGIYATGLGLAQYLTILPLALNTVMMPHLSKPETTSPFDDLASVSRLTATILLAPVLVFTFFSGTILGLLYGQRFEAAESVLPILAWSYWFLSLKHLYFYYNASQNKLKNNLSIELIGMLVGVSLNLKFTVRYGIEAAAITGLVVSLGTFLATYFFIVATSPQRQFNLFFINLTDLGMIRKLWSKRSSG